MSIDLQARYEDLRADFERVASAVAGLRLVILDGDANIAADMAYVCEFFACSVLDSHPRETRQKGGEA